MRSRARTIPFPSQHSNIADASCSRVTTPDTNSGSSLHKYHSYSHGAYASETYTIYQTLKPNYTILASDGLPIYYIATKGLHPASPYLTMYVGKNTWGPIVGFVESSGTGSGRTAKLVRGDPSSAHTAIWEDLQRIDSWHGVRYRFEMAVVDVSGYVLRRGFVWKRTRAFSVNQDATAAAREHRRERSYKLVEEENGQVLAVFSVDFKTGVMLLGKMRFFSERYGMTFRMMAVLSGLAVKDWEDERNTWRGHSWAL